MDAEQPARIAAIAEDTGNGIGRKAPEPNKREAPSLVFGHSGSRDEGASKTEQQPVPHGSDKRPGHRHTNNSR